MTLALPLSRDCGDHDLPVDCNGYCPQCRADEREAASTDARTEIACEVEAAILALDTLAVDCRDSDERDDESAVSDARVLLERAAELLRGRWYRPGMTVAIVGLERTGER